MSSSLCLQCMRRFSSCYELACGHKICKECGQEEISKNRIPALSTNSKVTLQKIKCPDCFDEESKEAWEPVEAESQPEESEGEFSKCWRHPECLLDKYCTTTDEPICSKCEEEEFSNSYVSPIVEVAKEKQEELPSYYKFFDSKLQEVQEALVSVEQELQNLTLSCTAARETITGICKEKSMTLEQEAAVLSKVQVLEEQKRKRLEAQAYNLKQLYKDIRTLRIPQRIRYESIIKQASRLDDYVTMLQKCIMRISPICSADIQVHINEDTEKSPEDQIAIIHGNCFKMRPNPTVTSFAGSYSTGFKISKEDLRQSRYNVICDCIIDKDGRLVLTDNRNDVLRSESDTVLAGGKYPAFPGIKVARPYCLTQDIQGNIYFSDAGCINRLVKSTSTCEVYAGTGKKGSEDGPREKATFNNPNGMYCDPQGNLYVCECCENGNIRRISPNGEVTTVARNLAYPSRITNNPYNENELFFTSYHSINKLDLRTNTTTVLAGSKTNGNKNSTDPMQALFSQPEGICVFNGKLLVVDCANHDIRSMDLTTGHVTTFAGVGQQGLISDELLKSRFKYPAGITVDNNRQCIFVTDEWSVRMIQ